MYGTSKTKKKISKHNNYKNTFCCSMTTCIQPERTDNSRVKEKQILKQILIILPLNPRKVWHCFATKVNDMRLSLIFSIWWFFYLLLRFTLIMADIGSHCVNNCAVGTTPQLQRDLFKTAKAYIQKIKLKGWTIRRRSADRKLRRVPNYNHRNRSVSLWQSGFVLSRRCVMIYLNIRP